MDSTASSSRHAGTFGVFVLYGVTGLLILGGGLQGFLAIGVAMIVSIGVATGVLGMVVWSAVYESCRFGSAIQRGAVAGGLVGLLAPGVALFAGGVALVLSRVGTSSGVATGSFVLGHAVASFGAAIPILFVVGWLSIPMGVGFGLVLVELRGAGSNAGDADRG